MPSCRPVQEVDFRPDEVERADDGVVEALLQAIACNTRSSNCLGAGVNPAVLGDGTQDVLAGVLGKVAGWISGSATRAFFRLAAVLPYTSQVENWMRRLPCRTQASAIFQVLGKVQAENFQGNAEVPARGWRRRSGRSPGPRRAPGDRVPLGAADVCCKKVRLG